MQLKERSFTFEVSESELTMLVSVLTDDIRENETVYGREGGEVLGRRIEICRQMKQALLNAM